MATVYLGIGSNLGNRLEFISKAIELLRYNNITIEKISTIIETDPVGGPVQPKFLNGVIKTQTNLSARELLNILKRIENTLGRIKTIIDGPRTIDLDILLYDDLAINEEGLTIPHPRMWNRQFVTTPLKEIAPEIIDQFSHASN